MDIYQKKSRWKWYLALAGIIIVLVSMVYTNYLTSKLEEEERGKSAIWLEAMEWIPKMELGCDLTLHYTVLQSNKTIPVILYTDSGKFIEAINIDEDRIRDTLYFEQKFEQFQNSELKPIIGDGFILYYEQSTLLTLIQYFPIFQLILVGAFILFGYFAFSSARRAEQNRVWAGMAKETAHQLGTPISGIVAWIEHLQALRENDEEVGEILEELRNDVTRLELIADRFSKIGSAPKLESINMYDELEKCRKYMQRRAPRRVVFDFPDPEQNEKPLNAYINPHLFDWVVENLLRNALDAMGSTGQISANVYDDSEFVYIDISDTGKGIPQNKFRTIFQPGFTTKKRGWGLGLSLAKRIIEDYHSGRIFVKKSMVDEGTTFSIQLPKSIES